MYVVNDIPLESDIFMDVRDNNYFIERCQV